MQKARRVLGVLFVMYLLQTTVWRFFPVFGVQPDLMAVAIVCLCLDGDTYTGFCAGAVTGLLLDAMIGQIAIIYLLFYPLMGYLAAAIPRAIWTRRDSIPLRFLLAPAVTLFTVGLLQGLTLGYLYLNGTDMSLRLGIRALVCVLYSALLALPAQWPIRWVLYRVPKKARRRPV